VVYRGANFINLTKNLYTRKWLYRSYLLKITVCWRFNFNLE